MPGRIMISAVILPAFLLSLAAPFAAAQSTTCTFAVNPTSSGTFSGAGGAGSFQVITSDPSCSWTLLNGTLSTFENSRVNVSTLSGRGSGIVSYTVSPWGDADQQFIAIGSSQFVTNGGLFSGNPNSVAIFIIPALGSSSALQITTSILPNVINGQPYSFQLIATGGTPPYTWYSLGGVPASLSTSGLISSGGQPITLPPTSYTGAPEIYPQLAEGGAYVTDSAGNQAFANMPYLDAMYAPTPSPAYCANYGGDTDGDGLCDDWEKNGIKDSEGNMLIDLPAMGSNPLHKDVFVQIDYMIASNHSHQPMPAAMVNVMKAFAAAPVGNPDNTTGINLHIDCGPDCIMILPDIKWGLLSEAKGFDETDENQTLGSDTEIGGIPFFLWNGAFDSIKEDNNFTRAMAFHYCIFAHWIAGQGDHSGLSRGQYPDGQSDFIVSLGSFDKQIGTASDQSNTTMHELGHNLGLSHGGSDAINFKPNYLSIMNYFFQLPGLIVNGYNFVLDYSRFQLPTLNEKKLNEEVGLNGGDVVANYGTYFYCPNYRQQLRISNVNGWIDWNCDGLRETDVASPIDGDASYSQPLLVGYNDWANLVYTGGAIGESGMAPLSTPLVPTELGPSNDANVLGPFNVAIDSLGRTQIPMGTTETLSFVLRNRGSQADTYVLTSAADYPGWANFTNVPTTVTLASGATQTINVPITIPSATVVGTVGHITISAVSQTTSNVADIGTSEITVVSNSTPSGLSTLSGSIEGVIPGPSIIVHLQILNTGTGPAFNTTISGLTARTLSGSGSVSPGVSLPLYLGYLSPGGSASVDVMLNVPSSVTRFSLTENGVVHDASGAAANFSIGEVVQPR